MNISEIHYRKMMEGLPTEVKVIYKVGKQIIDEAVIYEGKRLKVWSPSKRLKHHNREILVMGFTVHNYYGVRAKVKFIDNNRCGFIELDNLRCV